MFIVIDKTDLRIPFKLEFVTELLSSTDEAPRGQLLDVVKYGFEMNTASRMVDGVLVHQTMKAKKWETIASSISGIAIGFFPEGHGFDTWPHVRVKCSPAKILQGHNVFGSEDCFQGVMQMLSTFYLAYPLMYEHLDIKQAKLMYLDVTYSCLIQEFFRKRIYALFESLASKNTKLSKNDEYIQLGVGSEFARQKIYYKMQELLADLKSCIRSRDTHRVHILSDSRLHEFTINRTRFEATVGPRKFQALAIPTNFFEFIKFSRWFEQTHSQPLAQYLWSKVFDPLFAQIEGHTIMNVNDDEIKLRIYAKLNKIKPNGKICRRLSRAVFDTYCDIKREGYKALCSYDNKTFFRNVKLLEECGLSKAFLKSIDPYSINSNVIPFIQIIKIDFNKQRPDWYVEPKADFSDTRRHLKLVG